MNGYTCPLCGTLSPVNLMPVDVPCPACWREVAPQQRAPWIRLLRAVRNAGPSADISSRDPVQHTTDACRAYVEYLEGLLDERCVPSSKETALLAEVKRLRAENDELRAEREDATTGIYCPQCETFGGCCHYSDEE